MLRLVAGILLIQGAVTPLVSGAQVHMTIGQLVVIAGGTLLVLGLWTPVAGAMVFLIEIYFIFLGTAQTRADILLGALGAALAVLGPGHQSVDALRYGRRRFTIGDK